MRFKKKRLLTMETGQGLRLRPIRCEMKTKPMSLLGQKRKCPGSRGTSVLPSRADIVSVRRHVRLVPTIGIGGSLAAPPLPHHRTYGSVYGGSRRYANPL